MAYLWFLCARSVVVCIYILDNKITLKPFFNHLDTNEKISNTMVHNCTF